MELPRKCTENDIPWMMEFGAKMYGKLLTRHHATEEWLKHALTLDSFLILRTDNAAVICTCVYLPFHETPQTSVYLFAGKPRELLRLFGEAVKWSRSKSAEKLHFRSTTEHDIVKFAKLLGADVEYPAYSLRL